MLSERQCLKNKAGGNEEEKSTEREIERERDIDRERERGEEARESGEKIDTLGSRPEAGRAMHKPLKCH